MADFIGIDISGDIEVKQKIAQLGPEISDNGVETANGYIISVERNYAPSHKGEPFLWNVLTQQRAAAMAKMREQGGPPYSRTQELARGWKAIGSGVNQIVVNETPYAKWVKDPPIPGHAAREWTSISQDIVTHLDKILAKFSEGARKAIQKLGLD